MLDFLLSDAAPLGKVTPYFYRREYQSRGLQHFHILLWVKDAPVLDTSKKEDVAEFILEYVSCSVPDATTSPTLYFRVNNYQTHHHNSNCMKNKKSKDSRRSVVLDFEIATHRY
uniref:Helitron helicase-like domain-containing protein n=1 Tax=Cacopsylla melanoneura TaxID=428564 RepID=A0A8D8PQV6_9HEMI